MKQILIRFLNWLFGNNKEKVSPILVVEKPKPTMREKVRVKRKAPPTYIFKNNGIKYRKLSEMNETETSSFIGRGYKVFSVEGVEILAYNFRRALQTYKRIQYV